MWLERLGSVDENVFFGFCAVVFVVVVVIVAVVIIRLCNTIPAMYVLAPLRLLALTRRAKYCDERVCLSVCLSVRPSVRSHT